MPTPYPGHSSFTAIANTSLTKITVEFGYTNNLSLYVGPLVRNPTKAWFVGFHLRSTQPTIYYPANYQLPITNYQLPITNYQLALLSIRKGSTTHCATSDDTKLVAC